jgi:fibronectin type 3 domain-containing protein
MFNIDLAAWARGLRRNAGWLPLLILLGAACSKDHSLDQVSNPRDPAVLGWSPPHPVALTAAVGNRVVTLDWSLDDSTYAGRIARYRIYRRAPDQAETAVDSTTAPPITIRGLTNGVTYHFSVAAVVENGFEGKRSDEIAAVPGAYGVQIENGRERVNTTQVRLSMLAPTGTTGMRIGNQPDLGGVAVQPFLTAVSWQLEPTDGEKTVSVEFLDAEGNASSPVSDTVVLDTQAEIQTVSFSPAQVNPGELLFLSMQTGEAGGTAEIELGAGGRVLQLHDNGDGSYSLEYRVEEDLEVVEGVVTGRFTDSVGNAAATQAAPGHLTVVVADKPPHAVTLNTPSSFDENAILLSWSRNDDLDFASYELYRSLTAGVGRTGQPLQTFTEREETSYPDRGLTENTTYYYRVFVVDKGGNATGSTNELHQTTKNADPDPVQFELVQRVVGAPTPTVRLSWEPSTAHDFQEYDIYRDTSPAIGQESQKLVRTVPDSSVVTFDDAGLQDNTRYYYRIFVKDDAGGAAGSDERSVVTENFPPGPITLTATANDTSSAIILTWTKSADHDFDKYVVRKGVTPENLPTVIGVFRQKDQTGTSFFVNEGDSNRYFFEVTVHDAGVAPNSPDSTESNVASAKINWP